MESAGLTAESCVLDVGGGDSRLVDYLVAHGLDCVAVLDVSGAVLDAAKERLGASSPEMVFAGAALWGLHMAATQGLLAKLVADAAPADLLGTGFGVFHLVSGVAMLLASLIAGVLWNAYGAPATFVAGAALAATASVGLATLRPRA